LGIQVASDSDGSSLSETYLLSASQTISQNAATAKNHDDQNTERPLPQLVAVT
jgi:hypothetical protein